MSCRPADRESHHPKRVSSVRIDFAFLCFDDLLRATSAFHGRHDHVLDGKRIPFARAEDDDEYATNIQIADLNALNAALAVVKWKKLLGFYLDLEGELHTTYALNGNEITNEETGE
jgi:hypothetical protein